MIHGLLEQARKPGEHPSVVLIDWIGRGLLCVASFYLAHAIFCVLRRAVFRWPPPVSKRRYVKSVAVLGSGGHTAEMLSLIGKWPEDRFRFTLVIGATDVGSEAKARAAWRDRDRVPMAFIPRAREVGEGWGSTAWSTMKAFLHCVDLVYRLRPEFVIVNGPGTCVPVVVAALLFEVLLFRRVAVVFVESICRCSSLSMTGKILYYVADRVLVQWEALQTRYPRAVYIGVVI
jgi:beta-1,4-N-acetylglucosaminyltransferase